MVKIILKSSCLELEIFALVREGFIKRLQIYASCSADYDTNSEVTKEFFATVQNKLHYAITGETAAEIVKHRANAMDSNMGLRTWKQAPEGKLR